MKSELFFKRISDGLIDYPFCYDIWSYTYTVHNVGRHDTSYRMPSIEQSDASGVCSIDYFEEDEVVFVCIDNMAFDWNDFPSRFSSKVDVKKCRIEGEEDEDIRTVIIPFDDMSDNPNDKYRIELMFKDKELISIILVISKMDEHFNGTMKNLQLIGEIDKG